MEDTASHETVYKLAHRADKANFLSESDPTILTIVTSFNFLVNRLVCSDLGFLHIIDCIRISAWKLLIRMLK